MTPPLRFASVLKLLRGLRLSRSLNIEEQIPKFRTSAWTIVTPPLCRMPPDRNSGFCLACPGALSRPRFWHRLQLSTLLRWFIYIRLIRSYLTGVFLPFPMTLTTTALYGCSSGWFGVASW